jgi:hypothetical protein
VGCVVDILDEYAASIFRVERVYDRNVVHVQAGVVLQDIKGEGS